MQYVLKLSIALAVVYLFYWLLLRKLTFYNWNRWYLLAYSVLCFFIPLINLFDLLQQHGLQNAAVISYIPAITAVNDETATPGTGIDWWMIYIVVIAAGSLLMMGRLLVQFLSLRRLRSSAVLLSDGSVKLYHVDKKIIPFSTGSAIYVNRHLHNEQELKEIIHHEFIHVKQRHSFDLWWGEILCILNWYNPFAWLIRKAMRQNLEFIADHQVLQSGLDRKQYQYLLLKVTGIAPFSIASNFNFSSLKKRIVMMNKNKSANVHLMRFIFMLPLLVVVLLAFRKVAVNNIQYTEKKITDTVPAAVNVDDVFKKKGIKQIIIKASDKKDKKAEVIFKNGTTKVFDLTNAEEREAFESEYGDVAPPPPPAAPRPPVKVSVHPASPAPAAGPDAAPGPVPAAPVERPITPAAPPKPPVAVKGSGSITIVETPIAASPVEVSMNARTVDIVEAQNVPAINKKTVLTADVIEIRPVEAKAPLNIEEETELLVELKNTTTRQELEQLTNTLKEKGYVLTLNNVNFDNGQLVSVEGSINNGVKKGTFSGDHFKTLTISVSKANAEHFYITVRGGSVSFQ